MVVELPGRQPHDSLFVPTEMSSSQSSRVYHPSPRDILIVSALLASTPLPPELIDIVLDQAEYWASITSRLESGQGHTSVGRSKEHVLLLRCKPICSGAADEGHYTAETEDGEAGLNGETKLDGGTKLANEINADVGGLESTDALAKPGPGSWMRYYASLPAEHIPEPRSKFPVRRITWKIRSHDQGWGGEGGDTYEKSWTGFRGNVLRYQHTEGEGINNDRKEKGNSQLLRSKEYLSAWETLSEQSPSTLADNHEGKYVEGDSDQERIWPRGEWHFGPTRIQVNARAERDFKNHVIVWDFRDNIEASDPKALEVLIKKGRGSLTGSGAQVRALQLGDIVELHSYAFFPLWSNHVDHAEVKIEFAL